jgi:hypothetical protein
MIRAMLRRALLVAVIVGLGAASAPVLWFNWSVALVVEEDTRHKDPETYFLDRFYPGMPEAVAMLRAAARPVYSLHREQAPPIYQWLFEMLYPVRATPYEAARLAPGDLVVLDAGRELEVPHDRVFDRGLVRILRVR